MGEMKAITSALVLLILTFTQGLQFEVPANRDKCFSEDLAYDVLVKGSFSAPQSALGEVHMWILDPNENKIWVDTDSSTGTFAFASSIAGVHSFCFDNVPTGNQRFVPAVRVTFDLAIGVDAEDYDALAITEELSPLEIELRKLEDAAIAVNKHMNYMRQREAAMRDTNESSNSRVLWFSFLSMSVLLSLGIWQIVYLKKYFRSRKLIQ